MKTFNIKVASVAFCLLSGVFFGCDEDEPNVVLQPRTQNSAIEQLNANPDFSTFVEALKIAGLDGILKSGTDVTVFAPNNNAFASYLQNNGYVKVSDIPADDLKNLLDFHIASSVVESDALTSGGIGTMLSGSNIWALVNVDSDNNDTVINQTAVLLNSDIEVANGLIHEISSVLEPTGDYEKWKASYIMKGQFSFFEDCSGALWQANIGLSEGLFGVKQMENFADWGFLVNVIFNADNTLTIDSETPSWFGPGIFGSGQLRVVGSGTWNDTSGEETFSIAFDYIDVDNGDAIVDSCTHSYIR